MNNPTPNISITRPCPTNRTPRQFRLKPPPTQRFLSATTRRGRTAEKRDPLTHPHADHSNDFPETQSTALPHRSAAVIDSNDALSQIANAMKRRRTEVSGNLSVELPILRATAAQRDVVIVGGIAKQQKLVRLVRRTNIALIWVSVPHEGTPTITSLATRIRSSQIAAMVILDGLLGHADFHLLIAAARHEHLPVAYGAKAGMASLLAALTKLESKLATNTHIRSAQ